MTRQNQKVEEVRLVEQMRQKLGGVPPGQIEPGDEPDVLVIRDEHRTGIEVTELHQRPERGKGPRRLQESERAGIVRRAQALAEASGMPVVSVAVHFNDFVPITKRDRETLAIRLVELVSKNMPEVGRSVAVKLWRQTRNPPPSIRTVRLYRAKELTRHHWAVPDSGWVQMDFAPELQHAIDAKNAKHARYRQYCDECWLLIVASGGRPSGLFEPSAETMSRVYRSCFARTFFMEAFAGVLIELYTTAA
jgi:hypothetical protein